jgi:hypothetical protein
VAAALVVMSSALVVLIAAVLLRMRGQAKRINDYFCNAVRVYAFTGAQDAGIAALAAAKVAAGTQRNSMVAYLRGIASDVQDMSESEPELRPIADQFVEAASHLEKDITVKDWKISDIREQKVELGKANLDYLNALNKTDPSVFERKFPHLFK